jgi:hypothetical protein
MEKQTKTKGKAAASATKRGAGADPSGDGALPKGRHNSQEFNQSPVKFMVAMFAIPFILIILVTLMSDWFHFGY